MAGPRVHPAIFPTATGQQGDVTGTVTKGRPHLEPSCMFRFVSLLSNIYLLFIDCV